MSWDFSGAGEFIGTFGSTVSQPMTLCAWVKAADHTTAQFVVNLGHSTSTPNDSLYLGTGNNSDGYSAGSRAADASIDAAEFTASAGTYDGIWVPIVTSHVSDTSRKVYVEEIGNIDSNTVDVTVGTTMNDLTIASRLGGGQSYTSNVAEVVFYEGTMSDADITSYLAGTKATSLVGAANIIGYYSLDTDDNTPDDESGNGGPALSLNGTAVFDTDHPIISGANPKGPLGMPLMGAFGGPI